MLRFAVPLALIAGAAQAEPTVYPLTLKNCGHSITFARAPDNIVSVGQAMTETLYALGLADQMAGTALWFNTVLPAFADADAKVARLADNTPSFEAVVNKQPGLVTSTFEWSIGPQGAVGTWEQFADLGIPVYTQPADCVGKDNLVGADGTRTAAFGTDSVYQGIEELAEITDRQDIGAALLADLRRREAAAIAKAKALDLHDASAVVWFSSADMDLDPFVAGRKGVPAYMMDALGLRNVVTSDEEWPTVGWESIARANPSVIVLARMERRRFPADDVEAKLAFLKADPVTRQMDAVKNGRIVILDAEEMHPSLRLFDGLEKLSDGMEALAR